MRTVRRATRYERLVYWLTGGFPASYVQARLDWYQEAIRDIRTDERAAMSPQSERSA